MGDDPPSTSSTLQMNRGPPRSVVQAVPRHCPNGTVLPYSKSMQIGSSVGRKKINPGDAERNIRKLAQAPKPRIVQRLEAMLRICPCKRVFRTTRVLKIRTSFGDV